MRVCNLFLSDTYIINCTKNKVTLRKGLFLFSLIYLLSIGIGISLAVASELGDPIKRNTERKGGEDLKFKTDSTEVNESSKPYHPESGELGSFDDSSSKNEDLADVENNSPTVTSNDGYYDNDEDSDETSQSMISFNFLYYLLQKFKLSDSLGY